MQSPKGGMTARPLPQQPTGSPPISLPVRTSPEKDGTSSRTPSPLSGILPRPPMRGRGRGVPVGGGGRGGRGRGRGGAMPVRGREQQRRRQQTPPCRTRMDVVQVEDSSPPHLTLPGRKVETKARSASGPVDLPALPLEGPTEKNVGSERGGEEERAGGKESDVTEEGTKEDSRAASGITLGLRKAKGRQRKSIGSTAGLIRPPQKPGRRLSGMVSPRASSTTVGSGRDPSSASSGVSFGSPSSPKALPPSFSGTSLLRKPPARPLSAKRVPSSDEEVVSPCASPPAVRGSESTAGMGGAAAEEEAGAAAVEYTEEVAEEAPPAVTTTARLSPLAEVPAKQSGGGAGGAGGGAMPIARAPLLKFKAHGDARAKPSRVSDQSSRSSVTKWVLGCNERPSIRLRVPFELSAPNIDNLFKILLKKGAMAQKQISSAKVLCSLAYPDELYPSLRQRIFDSGLIPVLMQMAQEGLLRVYRPIDASEVELGEMIAKGAGGQVRHGVYRGQEVAVKLCGESYTFYTSAEEFRFEVAAMVLLHHEHILPCLGANEEDEKPFMITPLKERGPITNLLSFDNPAKKLPLSMKMQLAMQVAQAMCHLHRCRVLHRDLKPSNILVGKDMTVSLIDFGVSRVRDAKRPMTMNVGTTAYIAPEVFEGDGAYTSALDVYSFAIVLWEIVFEAAAFAGTSNFEIPGAVVRGERPPLDACVPALCDLIRQCWHQNPKQRPKFTKIVSMLQDVMDDAIWNTGKKKSK